MKFIDLFAGIGGFRLAFESLGCECVFSSEIDKWAIKTYTENFKDTPHGDIRDISADEIPDFDILCGGFPCQAFSISGQQNGFKDVRGELVFEVVRILRTKKPGGFLLENVEYLLHHDNGRTFTVILEMLKMSGYKVFYEILNSKNYGVAQKRKRIYFVGFRDFRVQFSFPKPCKNNPVIRDIMEHNVPLKYYLSQKGLDGYERHKIYNENKGHSFGYRLNSLDSQSYTLVVSRGGRKNNMIADTNVPKDYDKNNKFIRYFTPRELARLQGFPEDFIIPVSDENAYCQFGNTVSVPVIEAIAERILEVL